MGEIIHSFSSRRNVNVIKNRAQSTRAYDLINDISTGNLDQFDLMIFHKYEIYNKMVRSGSPLDEYEDEDFKHVNQKLSMSLGVHMDNVLRHFRAALKNELDKKVLPGK